MERISRFRAILLLILFISILALFAVKLFDLQIIETNGNTDNIAKYTTVTTVRAARGDILDRNGNKLVGNRASYNLVFNHYVIESYGQTNEAPETVAIISAAGDGRAAGLPLSFRAAMAAKRMTSNMSRFPHSMAPPVPRATFIPALTDSRMGVEDWPFL